MYDGVTVGILIFIYFYCNYQYAPWNIYLQKFVRYCWIDIFSFIESVFAAVDVYILYFCFYEYILFYFRVQLLTIVLHFDCFLELTVGCIVFLKLS